MSLIKQKKRILKKTILGLGVASAFISILTVSLSIYLNYCKDNE